jgi:hypothetical protein
MQQQQQQQSSPPVTDSTAPPSAAVLHAIFTRFADGSSGSDNAKSTPSASARLPLAQLAGALRAAGLRLMVTFHCSRHDACSSIELDEVQR